MRMVFAAASVLAALVPTGPEPWAACPTDSLIVCGALTTSNAPTHSVVGTGYCTAGASYDLISGQLNAGAGGSSTDAVATVEDTYAIAGPNSVGTVAFTAQFVVQVGLAYVASASAFIRGGGDTQGFSTGSCICFPGMSFTQTLSLPLAYAVAEPFHLTLNVRGTAPHSRGLAGQASVTGRLVFVIPPEYTVSSCQGYGTPVTASRPRSWGRLKTLYR